MKSVKSYSDRLNARVNAAGRYAGTMTVLQLPTGPFRDPRKLRILDYKYGLWRAARGPSAERRTRSLLYTAP